MMHHNTTHKGNHIPELADTKERDEEQELM
jgi:hypothetical protein